MRKKIKKKFKDFQLEARSPSAKKSLDFLPRIASIFPTTSFPFLLESIQKSKGEGMTEDFLSVILNTIQEISVLIQEQGGKTKESLSKIVGDLFEICEVRIISVKAEEDEWKDSDIDLYEEWDDHLELTDLPEILGWLFTSFFGKR